MKQMSCPLHLHTHAKHCEDVSGLKLVYLDKLLINEGISSIVNSSERVVFFDFDGRVEEPRRVVDDAEQKDETDNGIRRIDVASGTTKKQMISTCSSFIENHMRRVRVKEKFLG